MMVDTGAGPVSLSDEDAKNAGLDCSQGRKTKFITANGPTEGTVLSVPMITVEGVTLHDVDVSCGVKGSGPLLGLSALRRFNIRFTSNGYMVLSVPN